MANWTPEGWVGQFFLTMVPFLPPLPDGALPPVLWGSRSTCATLFGDRVAPVAFERVVQPIRFPSPAAAVDYYKQNFGPTIMAYRSLADDPGRTAELDLELLDLAQRTLRDGRFDAEYLRVIARRATTAA